MKRVVCLVTFLALSVAVSHVHAQAIGRFTRGPDISTTGVFRVSRDPKRTGSLTKLAGTDILRACNRSWNDDRCLNGGAYDAACGDANVQAYDRTKRRRYRLHPQPTLAKSRRRR